MKLNKKLLLVSLLYFAEGFPFGIIVLTLPVYFRMHGISMVHAGLLSLFGLPYVLKFLWAPAVDFLGTRRQWISAAQFLMAAFIVLILPLDPAHPDFLLWAGIFSLAIMSATQDVAVDVYTIEMLQPSEMGIANGFRMAAYRVAMLVSGSWFVTLGGRIGWKATFLIAAIILAGCSVAALKLPPVEVKRPRFSLTSVAGPVKDLFMRPGVAQVALFVLFYKLGDLALGPMVPIFWVDRGLSTDQIGLITGTLGMLATTGGGLAGGLFMARFGIFHGLWFLRAMAGWCPPELRVGCGLSRNRQLGDLRSLYCRVLLRRAGHGSLFGIPHERLQERVLRHSICAAHSAFQGSRNCIRSAERLGRNSHGLLAVFCTSRSSCVFQPSHFSLMQGIGFLPIGVCPVQVTASVSRPRTNQCRLRESRKPPFRCLKPKPPDRTGS